LVDDAQAQQALRAYRQLVRIARRPEREPAWPQILADLADAEAFYRGLGLDSLTPDQALDYRRIVAALKS
jgi:hypothetical protein